jgi:threonine synthase
LVVLLEGTISECGRWVRDQCESRGWFDLSTLREPYRVEGKKTMGFEIARDLGWRLPDVILYPTGGGTGLVGIWKAFEELAALGWLEDARRRPRLVAVQAAGCDPVVQAFLDGSEGVEAPPAAHTIAAGLRVPKPLGDRWMLRVLRASGGSAVAVDDEELLQGVRSLARSEGLFVAPEAGALVAAVHKLLGDGRIAAHEQVLLLSTGTGLKYLDVF